MLYALFWAIPRRLNSDAGELPRRKHTNGAMFLLVSRRPTTVVDTAEDVVVDVKITLNIYSKETGH